MSDPNDPSRVPTPPGGTPSIGEPPPVVDPGPGSGGAPTVAAPSVYDAPAPTAYGPGPGDPTGSLGPGGPNGPGGGDDGWGPAEGEPNDDRWKIAALVGLAVVVLALIIGGLILSRSGDDDEDPTTTTSSSTSSTSTSSTSTSTTSTSTTTTTVPTTTTTAPTTTTAAGPAGAPSPEAAAASLFDAWTAGDRDNAGEFADPGAVATLFSRDGFGNDLEFDACTSSGGGRYDCTYSNSAEAVVFEVDPVPSGYRVTGVSFPND